jgi:polyisoprenoid-binding protein YceI
MKTFKYLSIITLSMTLSAYTIVESTNWKIKDDFSIKFISKDPSGVFTKMDGTIRFNEADLRNALFDVKIDVNSINTGRGMQNKHAISEKWFDAEKYPYIHFLSEKFEKNGDQYTVSGMLTMHGEKKPFNIPFTFQDNTFKASFTINRTDYNIGKPGGKVPDELTLEISVPVTK